jgi:hypothetical protein
MNEAETKSLRDAIEAMYDIPEDDREERPWVFIASLSRMLRNCPGGELNLETVFDIIHDAAHEASR